MDIVVFGAGSLGSLIGGLLAREHPVTLVGRFDHVDAIVRDGLTIEGEIEETVFPEAQTDPPGRADLVIVTVKSYDTPTAVEALKPIESPAVLSLQNGMGNEHTLDDGLDSIVLGGTATYGAIQDRPGHVQCTGIGKVVLGAYEGGTHPMADRTGEAFAGAGIETSVVTDMPRRLWEKLAVNAGINAITALARVQNGALLDEPAHDLAIEAGCETARVARSQGIELSNDRVGEAIERVLETTADNESSMYRDVQHRQRTEIDAINGFVAESDESTPINETLATLVRTWEAGQGLRES